MIPAEKGAAVRNAWQTARALQRAGLRTQHPDESEEQLERRLAERWLGAELYRRVKRDERARVTSDDVIDAAGEIAGIFEALGVPFMIGGSLACTAWSVPRFTANADVVAALEEHHVAPLLGALENRWYADEAEIRDAITRRASFPLVRHRGMVEADVFVPPDEGLHQSKWSRVRHTDLDCDRELPITSPEDILLQKLDWYRRGGESSAQQWLDVTTLLRIQKEHLDHAYLDGWAERMELSELLARARSDR